jgi:hypothetical protein
MGLAMALFFVQGWLQNFCYVRQQKSSDEDAHLVL